MCGDILIAGCASPTGASSGPPSPTDPVGGVASDTTDRCTPSAPQQLVLGSYLGELTRVAQSAEVDEPRRPRAADRAGSEPDRCTVPARTDRRSHHRWCRRRGHRFHLHGDRRGHPRGVGQVRLGGLGAGADHPLSLAGSDERSATARAGVGGGRQRRLRARSRTFQDLPRPRRPRGTTGRSRWGGRQLGGRGDAGRADFEQGDPARGGHLPEHCVSQARCRGRGVEALHAEEAQQRPRRKGTKQPRKPPSTPRSSCAEPGVETAPSSSLSSSSTSSKFAPSVRLHLAAAKVLDEGYTTPGWTTWRTKSTAGFRSYQRVANDAEHIPAADRRRLLEHAVDQNPSTGVALIALSNNLSLTGALIRPALLALVAREQNPRFQTARYRLGATLSMIAGDMHRHWDDDPDRVELLAWLEDQYGKKAFPADDRGVLLRAAHRELGDAPQDASPPPHPLASEEAT